MSADTFDSADRFCAKCGSPFECWIRLPDGRERPVCGRHESDGEVIGDAD